MSLVLRYSNWFVTAILLLVGNRVLFVTLRGVLTPDSFWREGAVASLVQATVAVLSILAAVGTVRWKAWGRSLGLRFVLGTHLPPFFCRRSVRNTELRG